jgi:threonine/homoserine/homoserine lactone efflux protein
VNDLAMLAAAIGVGLGVSAPLGPVALIALRRGLSGDGAGSALTGCGAGMADAVIIVVSLTAAAGVTALLAAWRMPMAIGGGFVLIALGVAGMRGRKRLHANNPVAARRAGRRLLYALEGFGVAITNPGNITGVSAVALTALLRPSVAQPDLYAIGGFVLGSQIWWVGLGFASARFGERLAGVWIRRASFGLSLLLGAGGMVMVVWALAGLI